LSLILRDVWGAAMSCLGVGDLHYEAKNQEHHSQLKGALEGDEATSDESFLQRIEKVMYLH
jgi:hypothetical protein